MAHVQRGGPLNRVKPASVLFLAVGSAIFVHLFVEKCLAADSPRRAAAGTPSLFGGQSLARKRESQQRVRTMARDLVSAILDVQLQQLGENDLTLTDLYRDIQTMRKQIDAVIDSEMAQVVNLLAEIETAPGDRREKLFVAARQKSREILVRLLAERQRVLRRLRIAELAVQVRQLIEAEKKILAATQSLPEQPSLQRETLILSTIEDQRDTRAVYQRLHETVKEVAAWGGEVGSLASAGLEILREARVDAEMEAAAHHLEQTRFADAATREENAIKALGELLRILERVQGILKRRDASMEQAIREMIDRQREIRQATLQADPTSDTQQLVQQQTQVQKDLRALSRQARPAQPLEEASKIAEEAAAKLFEGKLQEAVAEQDKVLEKLANAVQSPPEQAKADNRAPAAAQSAQAISDLEAARRDLQKILEEQKQTSAMAVSQPAQARPKEEKIAHRLSEVPDHRNLPQAVVSRTADAQRAAAEAAAKMDSPPAERADATRAAEQAIQRVLSETERALADAKRQQLREAMNTLARAAEQVQKAAAMEHEVAQDARHAAEKNGLEPSQAHELHRKQAGVQQIAEDVAHRIEHAVPEASKTLAAARPLIGQAAERLLAAQRQPGEPSKPTAGEAGNQAEQAAKHLTQAAQQLREETTRAAERLARLTHEQLEQAQQALQSVEKAIAERPEPLADRIDRLAKAEEHVRKAQTEQDSALGRPPEQQPDAPAQTRVGQEVQTAQSLAERDAPKAAELLAEASKSSHEAHRQIVLGGDPHRTAKAQEETAGHLRQAAQQFAEAKNKLASQAAMQFAAQSQLARTLEDQTTPVDPGATGALQSAENQAARAAPQLPQSPHVVSPAERGVTEALGRAAADLAARVQELSEDQALAQTAGAQSGGDAPAAKPSDESLQTAQGGGVRKGRIAKNPPPTGRTLQVPDSVPDRDNRGMATVPDEAESVRDRVTEEPWFAQLPAEIRAAIRANTQRRAPRGYEERLQRYFKNLD